jgi:hypothetical protein
MHVTRVQHNNVVAAADHMADHRRADKSGAAGDEDTVRQWRAARHDERET